MVWLGQEGAQVHVVVVGVVGVDWVVDGMVGWRGCWERVVVEVFGGLVVVGVGGAELAFESYAEEDDWEEEDGEEDGGRDDVGDGVVFGWFVRGFCWHYFWINQMGRIN